MLSTTSLKRGEIVRVRLDPVEGSKRQGNGPCGPDCFHYQSALITVNEDINRA